MISQTSYNFYIISFIFLEWYWARFYSLDVPKLPLLNYIKTMGTVQKRTNYLGKIGLGSLCNDCLMNFLVLAELLLCSFASFFLKKYLNLSLFSSSLRTIFGSIPMARHLSNLHFLQGCFPLILRSQLPPKKFKKILALKTSFKIGGWYIDGSRAVYRISLSF